MLEFCDLPYVFVPPRPSRFWMRVGGFVNRFWYFPKPIHRIRGVGVDDPHGLRQRLAAEGSRHLLFVANHSRHSDPQVMTEAFRRIGASSCFMAAYELFHRGKLDAWMLPRLGVFSVDREGSDIKAMRAAGAVLREGSHALTVFPEGNVYLTNDAVTPFLEGAAFAGLRAQRELEGASVRVVPVSIKYTLVADRRDAVRRQLAWLAGEAGLRLREDANPRDELARVGLALLARMLAHHGYEAVAPSPEETERLVREVPRAIIRRLQETMGQTQGDPDDPAGQIRKLRSAIHQARTGGASLPAGADPDRCAREAMLAQRVLTYKPTYIRGKPTLDRFAETVEKITEDWTDRMADALGRRRAVVRFNEAIDLAGHLAAFTRSPREAVARLTRAVEESVQRGLDEVAGQLRTPGAEMFSTGSRK